MEKVRLQRQATSTSVSTRLNWASWACRVGWASVVASAVWRLSWLSFSIVILGIGIRNAPDGARGSTALAGSPEGLPTEAGRILPTVDTVPRLGRDVAIVLGGVIFSVRSLRVSASSPCPTSMTSDPIACQSLLSPSLCLRLQIHTTEANLLSPPHPFSKFGVYSPSPPLPSSKSSTSSYLFSRSTLAPRDLIFPFY